MFNNQITFKNHKNGLVVAKALLDEDYVVLLSYEEQFLIINYEWSERGANRDDVVFMRRDEFEEKYYEYDDEEEVYDL